MRAFEIGEPGDIDVVSINNDRPTPAPGVGQVLIEVHYAGLNFTDVLARRGAPGYATEWPFVPGMEVAGVVIGLGDGVSGWLVGDDVLAFTPDGGALAEYV